MIETHIQRGARRTHLVAVRIVDEEDVQASAIGRIAKRETFYFLRARGLPELE